VRPNQCKENVYKRNTYRRTGRGRSGFELHYNREQCRRSVKEGTNFCWQHQRWVPTAKENAL